MVIEQEQLRELKSEKGKKEKFILNSQFLLPELHFDIEGYSAVTLGTIGTDESKGLLIGGEFQMVGSGEREYQKTIEFELSTKNWDTNHPKTKHRRLYSSSSILPHGSPALCGGYEMPSMKSTETRGEDGEWNLSETAILHLGRWDHGTAVVNGSMFAIGGDTKSGIHAEIVPTNTVETWDLRDKSGWDTSFVPSMIEKRSHHTVSVVGDSFIVFGGLNSRGYVSALCEYLDVRSNRWERIPSMPSTHWDHSSIVIGDQIIIIGGFPATTKIDSYDLITNTWTTLRHKLLQSRSQFQAFAL
jgi:hypothetical protein